MTEREQSIWFLCSLFDKLFFEIEKKTLFFNPSFLRCLCYVFFSLCVYLNSIIFVCLLILRCGCLLFMYWEELELHELVFYNRWIRFHFLSWLHDVTVCFAFGFGRIIFGQIINTNFSLSTVKDQFFSSVFFLQCACVSGVICLI